VQFGFSKKIKIVLSVLLLLILIGASKNVVESINTNVAKLPKDLETEHKFLKWINRWKERFPQIGADSFKAVDDGEIFSSTNPRFTFRDINTEVDKEEIEKASDLDSKYIIISPDKLQFVDFRRYFTEAKEPTSSYVYYYGERQNETTIFGPLFECKRTNCWFDRGFFLTPDLAYFPEVREKVYPEEPERCSVNKICSYELFIHEFDFKKNKRTSYVSDQLLTDFDKIQKTLEDY
jgi:hypothetical protein